MSWKILIIEDEPEISKSIARFIEREGWEAMEAFDGETGLNMFVEEKPHLIILDLMLPGIPGFDVCKKVRAASDIPIIMLTAKAEEIDKLLGLELGADDYVTKPFSLRELMARAKAMLRRHYGKAPKVNQENREIDERQEQGDFALDLSSYQAFKKGELLELTPTEFQLLEAFCNNPNQVFSRRQLVTQVLGHYHSSFDRSVDSHISNLRKKIEEKPGNPGYLLTVHGVGYKFNPTGRK